MTVRRSPRLVSSLSRAGLGTAFAVAPSTASFALTWDSVPRPKVAHLSTCKAVSSGWLCLVRAVGLDDNRERPFPPLFIRNSDHGGFLHVGKLLDQLLDLQRRYPFSVALDDVLRSVIRMEPSGAITAISPVCRDRRRSRAHRRFLAAKREGRSDAARHRGRAARELLSRRRRSSHAVCVAALRRPNRTAADTHPSRQRRAPPR